MIYKRGKVYYIAYSAGGRWIRQAVGESRKLAETVLGKRKAEVREGKFLDVKKNEKIRFEDFADEYLEIHSKFKKSYNTDKKIIGLLKNFLGGKYLYGITSLDVERLKSVRAKHTVMRAKVKKTISPATVNRALAVLKSIFNKAILWGKIERNPCKGVEMFKVNNRRLRFLEQEEIPKLLSNCCEHLKPIVIVALNTGMRKGEILKLKWHDIDIKRNIITLLDTKNGEKREVSMNEVAEKALIAVSKHPDSPYIFCNKDGKPYGDIKKSFLTAIKKSDIIDFHFHDLRHTFASQLVMAGVGLNTVRELLGHKSLEMTIRYSHLSPDHKKRAVDLLGKIISTKIAQEPKTEEIGTIEDLPNSLNQAE